MNKVMGKKADKISIEYLDVDESHYKIIAITAPAWEATTDDYKLNSNSIALDDNNYQHLQILVTGGDASLKLSLFRVSNIYTKEYFEYANKMIEYANDFLQDIFNCQD